MPAANAEQVGGASDSLSTKKTPVFAAVERNGRIHRRVVADVTGDTLKEAIREVVDTEARIITDENFAYRGIGREYAGHDCVCHGKKEYARGDVNTNTVESSFALVKRGLVGIYHNVGRKHLHRYIWQYDFLWNSEMNDGERTVRVIQTSEGKRLMYKGPVAL